MKTLNFFGVMVLCILTQLTIAQTTTFETILEKDTVKLGETFTLEFKLENGNGEFNPPEISGLKIVGGPNFSSQYSMINGETNSSMSYSYYLQAEKEGEYYIGPASIDVGDEILESEPLKVVVLYDPNYAAPEKRDVKPAKRGRKKSIRI